MHSNVFAQPSSFVDRGAEFSFAVLVWGRELAVMERVSSSFVDLNEVRALLELLAHNCDELISAIGISRIRKNMLLGVVADGIFVPTKYVDGVAADSQAGTGNFATINGIAYRGVS